MKTIVIAFSLFHLFAFGLLAALAPARVEFTKDIPMGKFWTNDYMVVSAIQKPFVALEFQFTDNLTNWAFGGYWGSYIEEQVVSISWITDAKLRRGHLFWRVIEFEEAPLNWLLPIEPPEPVLPELAQLPAGVRLVIAKSAWHRVVKVGL